MNINENDENVEEFDLLPELFEETNDQQEDEVNDNDEESITEDYEELDEQPDEEADEKAPDADDVFAAQSFYSMLKERNLVPDKEITGWDELEQEIDTYKNGLPDQVRDSIIQSASPIAQSFVDYALNKPDLTEADLVTYLEAYQQDKGQGDIDSNDKARELLRPSLVSQWGENTADIMLDSLEDSDTLMSKAVELNVSKKEMLNKQATQARQEQEQYNTQFVQSIYSEFDNQPWQDNHKTHIKDFYQSGKVDATIQEIVKDPKSLVQLVNILNYYDTKEKTFNLDTYFNKAATKSTNSVRNNIKKGLQNRGSNTRVKKDQQGGFNPDLEMV
jgi:hypothetical protein